VTRHLTVRIAWHDNNWDGTVCQEPEKNYYCVGSNSLLSERLKRKRNLDIESQNAGKRLDKLGDYIPPCYWTSNAFSDKTLNVWHDHPFPQYEKTHKIREKLSGYSVFTWPFRLSFNHNQQNRRIYGAYPPRLEERIERFTGGFSCGKTIIFFYLNFDNPISADDSKYVLVGCATLTGTSIGKHFAMKGSEVERIRRGSGMQHYSSMNWVINTSYDFRDGGVLLPYKEYLDYIKQNPAASELLDEMKILLDEEYMIPNFKYVASDINDDSCIYLLTKLRESFLTIKKHPVMDIEWTNKQLDTLDLLLKRAYGLRGLYPSLGNVLNVVCDVKDDEEDDEHSIGNSIVKLIQTNAAPKNILDYVFTLVMGESEIPDYLGDYESFITEIRINIQQYEQDLLQKLCLFSLTQRQISRILHDFDTIKIESNPYLLCEVYVEQPDDDEVFVRDKKIGIITIDVGMFPNPHYLTRDAKLQNLLPSSPERLRAIILDHLRSSARYEGNCYAPVAKINDVIRDSPLFYKENIVLPKNYLTSDKCRIHFEEKLDIIKDDNNHYFYLKEIRYAEGLIGDGVRTLLSREDHPFEIPYVDEFLARDAESLEAKGIRGFSRERFVSERRQLIEGALKKSLYVLTGEAGSGKTHALKKIIEILKEAGEAVTLLAPTGKAALRLKDKTGLDAQTIHRFIYSRKFDDIIDNFEKITEPHRHKPVKNLIIDESSMVNLEIMAILFKMMTDGEMADTKRVIFVGDENQLPPIGYGRPFFDIIQYIKTDERLYRENFIHLKTNCRQALDDEIIRVADIFRGENRYHDKVLNQITSGSFHSRGFQVHLWKDADELFSKIEDSINRAVSESLSGGKIPPERDMQLNLLFGLTSFGYIPSDSSIRLDRFQILSPYRGAYFGTLGLNENIESRYKNAYKIGAGSRRSFPFKHSSKIIAVDNQYQWSYDTYENELILPNGSIGVVNNTGDASSPHRFYFPDLKDHLLDKLPGGHEKYELAYAITIHKSQGSDFEHVFIVIPNKRTLLSRELLYTALTRSEKTVTMFLQSDGGNILEDARRRSDIQTRQTSIFTPPRDYKKMYEPEPHIFVRSKNEYIIFKELKERDIEFTHEKSRDFWQNGEQITLRPDFTIQTDDGEFFWEHLGMLDRQDYSADWQHRRQLYEKNKLIDRLITTDDIGGVSAGKINELINDILNGTVRETRGSTFSLHHYTLSPEST